MMNSKKRQYWSDGLEVLRMAYIVMSFFFVGPDVVLGLNRLLNEPAGKALSMAAATRELLMVIGSVVLLVIPARWGWRALRRKLRLPEPRLEDGGMIALAVTMLSVFVTGGCLAANWRLGEDLSVVLRWLRRLSEVLMPWCLLVVAFIWAVIVGIGGVCSRD